MLKHGMFGTRVYRIWMGMKRRCYDKNTDSYRWYGKRGVSYCKEWEKFEPFYKWAKSNGYEDSLTIDRIDPNVGYCPENCRWVDIKTQQRNKRSNFILTYKNESHCCSEWAEILGIKYETLLSRKRRGYPVEEILFHKKGKLFYQRKSKSCKKNIKNAEKILKST